MKPSTLLAVLVVTVSSLTVAGCAHRHGSDHHASSSATAASHGSKMDRVAMCEHYSRMTPEERKARMQAHHANMSAEMLDQHEKMMREKCALPN